MKRVNTASKQQGIEKAKEFLYALCNSQTVLFLSGGSTPKVLYEILAKEEKLKLSAAAVEDERYGEKFHQDSNELLIKNSGLLSYFNKKNIQFFPILSKNLNIEDAALNYDKTVRYLFAQISKSIAIVGIGDDGHIVSIPPNNTTKNIPPSNSTIFVTEVHNFPAKNTERITLTFKALSQMDKLILLAFGEEKKKALELMFTPGSPEEVPARFLNQKGITEKTILITDQKV